MLERIEEGEATPMDLDILASVQENIIGNCLCVLGDSMAMPVGSIVKKFREEFEDHIQAARLRADVRATEGIREQAVFGQALSPAPQDSPRLVDEVA
jgi:NADH-quinone oxidoreductase subunit F